MRVQVCFVAILVLAGVSAAPQAPSSNQTGTPAPTTTRETLPLGPYNSLQSAPMVPFQTRRRAREILRVLKVEEPVDADAPTNQTQPAHPPSSTPTTKPKPPTAPRMADLPIPMSVEEVENTTAEVIPQLLVVGEISKREVSGAERDSTFTLNGGGADDEMKAPPVLEVEPESRRLPPEKPNPLPSTLTSTVQRLPQTVDLTHKAPRVEPPTNEAQSQDPIPTETKSLPPAASTDSNGALPKHLEHLQTFSGSTGFDDDIYRPWSVKVLERPVEAHIDETAANATGSN